MRINKYISKNQFTNNIINKWKSFKVVQNMKLLEPSEQVHLVRFKITKRGYVFEAFD